MTDDERNKAALLVSSNTLLAHIAKILADDRKNAKLETFRQQHLDAFEKATPIGAGSLRAKGAAQD